MLDRVELRVIHMGGKVLIVADRIFPVPALPDAAFAAVVHTGNRG